MKYYEIRKMASGLRRNQTPSEKLLWSYLKNRQLMGRKFNRQRPVIYESHGSEHFFFIPDFYCHREKLIVELDGGIHNNQKEKDIWRDGILIANGYKVLRFNNSDLLEIEKVLESISKQFAG
jgi:very-short-patch-repair endonuclease